MDQTADRRPHRRPHPESSRHPVVLGRGLGAGDCAMQLGWLAGWLAGWLDAGAGLSAVPERAIPLTGQTSTHSMILTRSTPIAADQKSDVRGTSSLYQASVVRASFSSETLFYGLRIPTLPNATLPGFVGRFLDENKTRGFLGLYPAAATAAQIPLHFRLCPPSTPPRITLPFFEAELSPPLRLGIHISLHFPTLFHPSFLPAGSSLYATLPKTREAASFSKPLTFEQEPVPLEVSGEQLRQFLP